MFIYLYMQCIISFKIETFSSLCEMSSSNPPSFLPCHHLPLFLYVFSFHLEIYLPNSWSFILVCIHFDPIFDFFVECHTTFSVYFAHTHKQSLPLLHLQNLPRPFSDFISYIQLPPSKLTKLHFTFTPAASALRMYLTFSPIIDTHRSVNYAI